MISVSCSAMSCANCRIDAFVLRWRMAVTVFIKRTNWARSSTGRKGILRLDQQLGQRDVQDLTPLVEHAQGQVGRGDLLRLDFRDADVHAACDRAPGDFFLPPHGGQTVQLATRRRMAGELERFPQHTSWGRGSSARSCFTSIGATGTGFDAGLLRRLASLAKDRPLLHRKRGNGRR